MGGHYHSANQWVHADGLSCALGEMREAVGRSGVTDDDRDAESLGKRRGGKVAWRSAAILQGETGGSVVSLAVGSLGRVRQVSKAAGEAGRAEEGGA